MKTKNQTEQALLELATNKAANEDGFPATVSREPAAVRKQAWSPKEVWRTRVKTAHEQNDATPA